MERIGLTFRNAHGAELAVLPVTEVMRVNAAADPLRAFQNLDVMAEFLQLSRGDQAGNPSAQYDDRHALAAAVGVGNFL